MPRTKQREINGRVFEDREFQQLLIEGLKAQPDDVDSSAIFLSRWLSDPDWDCPEARDALLRKLDSMCRGKKARIEKDGRGVFRVKTSYDRLGIDGVHEAEKAILAFLRENGGLARRRDLMNHMGVSERYEAVNLDKVIEKSNKVRTDFNMKDRVRPGEQPEGRAKPKSAIVGKHTPEVKAKKTGKRARIGRLNGVINLHPSQLHQMILEGRWVGRYFTLGAWSMPGMTDSRAASVGAQRADDFLRGIGRLAQGLREEAGMTMDEFVDRRGVLEALNGAVWRYSRRNKALHRLAGANAHKNLYADPHELRVLLYARFEGGEDENGIDLYRYGAHLAMHADFYKAWAEVYSLDPVALSRGVMMPDTSLIGQDDTDWEGFFASIADEEPDDEDLDEPMDDDEPDAFQPDDETDPEA